jgi:hypothetical protein
MTEKKYQKNIGDYSACLPCKPQGAFLNEDMESRLESTGKDRFSKDFSTCSDNIVATKFDVLCGRDREAFLHVGNRKFRAIIAKNRDMYQNAKTRADKYRIASEVIDVIHEYGGRFLKKDPKTNMWHNVGRHYTHEKVSHALRDAKDLKVSYEESEDDSSQRPDKNLSFETFVTEQPRIFVDLREEEEAVVDMGCAEGDHTCVEWRDSSVSL